MRTVFTADMRAAGPISPGVNELDLAAGILGVRIVTGDIDGRDKSSRNNKSKTV